MEQFNSNYTINQTQSRIIENLENKAQHINFIAESYHIENQKLFGRNVYLEEKLNRQKKLNIIVTTTAVILGLILIF